MSEFKRENRYLVLKRSDIDKYLSSMERDDLSRIEVALEGERESDGRAPLQCVVVEADWPEFEPVWRMIEARCTGADKSTVAGDLIEQLQDVQHDEQCEMHPKLRGRIPPHLGAQNHCDCYARAAIRLGGEAADEHWYPIAGKAQDEAERLSRQNAVMREALERISNDDDHTTAAGLRGWADAALNAAGGE